MYMIDKVDIPSIQYKMSFREPKSTRKVGRPSLTCINFRVPGLTPPLNSTDTSLQLS
jgi:hypothetical protein